MNEYNASFFQPGEIGKEPNVPHDKRASYVFPAKGHMLLAHAKVGRASKREPTEIKLFMNGDEVGSMEIAPRKKSGHTELDRSFEAGDKITLDAECLDQKVLRCAKDLVVGVYFALDAP